MFVDVITMLLRSNLLVHQTNKPLRKLQHTSLHAMSQVWSSETAQVQMDNTMLLSTANERLTHE